MLTINNKKRKSVFATPASYDMTKYTSQYDKMTKEPVSKLVLQLGIPTTISMLITSVYNMADTFFCGETGK